MVMVLHLISGRTIIIQPGRRGFPADLGMLPPEVASKMASSGETLVVVDKGDILDPTGDVVDIMDPGSDALDSVVSMGLGALNSVFPGVAALEGLGLLERQKS